MASLQRSTVFFLPLLLHAFFFLSHPVSCNDVEDKLFKGINNYRGTANLPALSENDHAGCLADEIAEKIEDQPCTKTTGAASGTQPRFSDYPDPLKKCHLNINNTKDGVILQACVPDLDSDLVLSNFTKTQYAKFLNDSKYTGAGIGSEGSWIVVILSTGTAGGSFEASDGGVGLVWMGGAGKSWLVSLLMGLLLALVMN
ncbi:uncharacterized GPI-anchored protein At3g06035-like [Malania oleifera]|uniref:uncharacterized GPI-anchored protein At3g06035-like n=1 Tax=Malania oleifera TaxID=397392 RepID=UPI0025AE0606|nr:uncharacterized GPI-anchored protein At3g06035-like [Malania oleifera]